MTLLRHIDSAINRWWTVPERNAAGRLGLFRIIYSLGHLWVTLSIRDYYLRLYLYPYDNWTPIPLIRWLDPVRPTLLQLQLGAALLIFGLVLLLIGYQTRLMTLLVLLTSTTLSILMYSLVLGHTSF